MKSYKYLFKNIGLLTLSQFGTKLLVFFLVPLYTNVLTTSEYGTYDLFNTTISLLIPVVTLNISDAVLLFSLEEKDKHSEAFSIGLKYSLVGFLLSIIFLAFNYIFGIFPTVNKYWYYFPVLFILTAINTFFSAFARGIERVKETAIGGVICSATMIACNLFLLLVLRIGLHGYFVANILGISAQIIYLFISCKLWLYITPEIDKRLEEDMRNYSIPLIANNVGWWINNSSDRYIVTWLLGVSEMGIYSVGYKIPSILNMFQTIFSQAWTMSAVRDFDSEDRNGFFSKVYNFYNCGMVLICSCIIITSRILAHFLYSKDFFVAWKYVPFLTIAIVFGSLAGFLGGIFAATKDSKLFGNSTLAGALLNIILNIILVYFIGTLGSAIATLISYYVVWLIRMEHVKKHISLKINLLNHYFSYIVLVIQGALLLFFSDCFKLYIVEIMLFIFLLMMYSKILSDIWNKMIKKINFGR